MHSPILRFGVILWVFLFLSCGEVGSNSNTNPETDASGNIDQISNIDSADNDDPGATPVDDITPNQDPGTLPSDATQTILDEGPSPEDSTSPMSDVSVPPQDSGVPSEEDTQQTIPPPNPENMAQCQEYTLCDAACQGNPTCTDGCETDFPNGKLMLGQLTSCLIEVCGSPNSFSFSSCSKAAKWDECLLEYAACYQGTTGCLTIRDCTLACTDWQCQNLCIWSGALTSQYIFTSLMDCIGNNCNQSCGTGDAAMCDSCVTQYCGVLRDECINDANN